MGVKRVSWRAMKVSCLSHDEGHSNDALRTELCSSVEGCPWWLHALWKPWIEDNYPTAVEDLTDSIQKFAIYNTYSNDGGNPYPTSNSCTPYPTPQTRHSHYNKSDAYSSSSTDPYKVHYTDKRCFKYNPRHNRSTYHQSRRPTYLHKKNMQKTLQAWLVLTT